MSNSNTTRISPSGRAEPRGWTTGSFEVTTGDGIHVAAHEIVEITVEPPRAGRLSPTLRYRAGLNSVRTSYWVEREHEAALRRLVDAVAATKGQV